MAGELLAAKTSECVHTQPENKKKAAVAFKDSRRPIAFLVAAVATSAAASTTSAAAAVTAAATTTVAAAAISAAAAAAAVAAAAAAAAVATAAAAVAAATAAEAAAARTSTATTTAAAEALAGFVLCFIDAKRTTVEVLSVPLANDGLCVLFAAHLNKGKTLGPACVAIGDDCYAHHLTTIRTESVP